MKLGGSDKDAPQKHDFLNCLMDYVLLSKFNLKMTQLRKAYLPTSVVLLNSMSCINGTCTCKSCEGPLIKLKKGSEEDAVFRLTKDV